MLKTLEHYEKAAKVLDLNIDEIMMSCVSPIIQEEQTREERKKMRKEMK